MELAETIRGRRSIRKFKPQAGPREKLEKILDLAMWAPSGMNRQDWYFVVVQGPKKEELLKIFGSALEIFRPRLEKVFADKPKIVEGMKLFFQTYGGAPVFILAYAGKGSADEWDTNSTAAALQNLMLAEGKWHYEDSGKAEADRSKVESFIRRLEGLEAAEFFDAPAGLADYGLAPPQAEISVWTRENDKDKDFQVLVGNEVAAKKQVVVRNPGLSYLFRVDVSFLADFPKDSKDWLPAPPAEKKPADKESPAEGDKK